MGPVGQMGLLEGPKRVSPQQGPVEVGARVRLLAFGHFAHGTGLGET